MRPILAAALLVLALPLSAQVLQTIEFDPPLPDSAMSVQLHLAGVNNDACVPSIASVSVNAKTIRIDLAPRPAACILLPTPWGERIDLGRLAPGNYDVTVFGPGQFEAAILGTKTLTVTDAQQPFEVQPSVVPVGGGTPVRIEINGGALLCAPSAAACQNVESLTIGGKPAQFQILNGSTILATAPSHAAGGAVIALKVETLPLMQFDAFRYFDPSDAPDPIAFDRVLFPVLFSGAGAFGSFWQTDAAIENLARGLVGEWRTYTFTPCIIAVPCLGPVDPGATGYLASDVRAGRGLLYFPERRHETSLRYGLHVRDSSRSAQDLGTEIPVVTTRKTTFDLSLLDIPTDTRYRRTLRIYDIDGVERSVNVVVTSMGEAAPAQTMAVPLTTGCTSAVCDAPAFASINLDPIVAAFPASRVRVRIVSPMHDARLWAVVTVTNNDTQHVTAYTPQ
jgi:hypothetical protein